MGNSILVEIKNDNFLDLVLWFGVFQKKNVVCSNTEKPSTFSNEDRRLSDKTCGSIEMMICH